MDRDKIKDIRLYGFFSFLLWPFLMVMALGIVVYTFIRDMILRSQRHGPKNYRLALSLIILPYHLIKLALKGGDFKIIAGIILLIPLMITAVLSVPCLFISKGGLPNYSVGPQPPGFYGWFGMKGAGLLGTNSEGVGIGKLVILGAWHTYFTSFTAAGFILLLGLALGAKTLVKRDEAIIMFFVEVIEAVPILFLLLVILAVFSWWEDVWKNAAVLFPNVFLFFRDLIIGIGIGIGFLPRMIRLIRERIKTFVSENFIDGAKAHGIRESRILWFHIIKKNCLGDIIVAITQIWAIVVLMEISLDYLVSISSLLGAKIYTSWAQMLLAQDVKEAIIFFKNWWLYAFPGFFVIAAVIGFYLFGEGLKSVYDRRASAEEDTEITDFDFALHNISAKIGLTEDV